MSDPVPAADLLDELRRDQREGWAGGRRVLVETYLERHADSLTQAEHILELVYSEVVLREEYGEAPALEEYLQRFPQLAEQLPPLFEVHRAIEAAGPNIDARTRGRGDAETEDTSPTSPRLRVSPSPRRLPAAELAADPEKTLPPGAAAAARAGLPQVPGYEILGELGRGGMGVVLLARQTGLNRLVALKMILLGDLAAREDLERFRQEAEAVAQLRHPNIVQIYEIGQLGDRPYFSLEYLEGGSLATRLAGAPLPPRSAAGLLRSLADAVQFAHDHGIIHRDLKPGNILLASGGLVPGSLVSGERSRADEARNPPLSDQAPGTRHQTPVPKITDFGLAKHVGQDSSRTRTGTVVGTPSYMAPEQAAGRVHDIGPAADIYALGAILYETLTGRPPFRAPTPLETLQQVLATEPVPPRRLQPHVPRDLETICLKCLRKEPARRYAGAGALAADLDRFLAGQPIQARRVSAWERGLKWTRRQPIAAALILVSVIAALVIALGGWWSYLRVRESREQERASFLRLLDTVDQLFREVGEVDLADSPHMEETRRRLLERAVQVYREFLLERGDDPALRQFAALAHSRLGDVQMLLGDHAAAEAAYRQAIAERQALAAEEPEQVLHRRELARTRNNLAVLLKNLNRLQEAEALLQEAVAERDLLAKQFPREEEYRHELATSRYFQGVVWAAIGRADGAEPAYRDAVRLCEELMQTSPGRLEYRRTRARALNNLGLFLHAHGKKEAEEAFRDAVGAYAGLVHSAPESAVHRWELARASSNLGAWLRDHQPGAPAAEECFRQALDQFSRLVVEFPKVPAYPGEQAGVMHNLARLRMARGQLAEAEQALRRAVEIRTQLADTFPEPPEHRHRLALLHLTLGSFLAERGRSAEAETAYQAAEELLGELTRHYPVVAEYRSALGSTHHYLARLLTVRSELKEPGQLAGIALASLNGNPLGLLAELPHIHLLRAGQRLERAMAEQQLALAAKPQNAFFRQCLLNDHALLALVCVRRGKHAAAARAAEQLPALAPERGDEYVRAAEFLAYCVTLAAGDPRLAEEQRRQAATVYGDRAVQLLRVAIEKKSGKPKELEQLAASLRELPAFEALRQRGDFQRLIKQIEERAKTAVG